MRDITLFRVGAKTGQMTLIVLILTFVALIIYVAMLPTVVNHIDPVATDLEQQGDKWTAFMLRLFPFLILVGLLMSFLWYVMPRRE